MQFLRRNTDRPAKITLPGPFTMAQQARNEFYRDVEEMAMDFAAAVNAEAHDLQAAGADVIQLDEPWLRNDPEAAKRFAVPAINRALAGITVPTALHLCFGYAAVIRHQKPSGYSFLPELAATTAAQISIEAAQPRLDLGILADLSGKTIILGVIDLSDPAVETADQVATRIRAGLTRVPPERLILAPDCGMKYLPARPRSASSKRSPPPRTWCTPSAPDRTRPPRAQVVKSASDARYRFSEAGRIADLASEAGLRRGQRPASTAVRKSRTARLNASGSSRLMVWPALGRTTSPAAGILRFMKTFGSRQGSSSSPVITSVGVSRRSICSPSSKTDGRVICTPRNVRAWPRAEPAANWSWNSCQPCGSLSMNCTRVGPRL